MDRSLTRYTQDSNNPKVQQFASQGAKVVPVSYSDPSSLKNGLTGVDVLISTLGGPAIDAQVPLVEAAKAAGVQLFVPSEYGVDSEVVTQGLFSGKTALHSKLRELGLAYTLVFTGPFADYIWVP